MSWYFQHQRAREIIAEREREAARIRLRYLLEEDQRSPARSGRSPIRRAIGGAILALGEAVTRVGRALRDAEATPTA